MGCLGLLRSFGFLGLIGFIGFTGLIGCIGFKGFMEFRVGACRLVQRAFRCRKLQGLGFRDNRPGLRGVLHFKHFFCNGGFRV